MAQRGAQKQACRAMARPESLGGFRNGQGSTDKGWEKEIKGRGLWQGRAGRAPAGHTAAQQVECRASSAKLELSTGEKQVMKGPSE